MKDKLKAILSILTNRKIVVTIVTTLLVIAGAFGLKGVENEQAVVDVIVNAALIAESIVTDEVVNTETITVDAVVVE